MHLIGGLLLLDFGKASMVQLFVADGCFYLSMESMASIAEAFSLSAAIKLMVFN